MGRPGGPGPLDPIFDVATSYGSIAIGNTPGATPLTVTINQAAGQDDPTSDSPILFDVVFSEAVTGFGTGDVTITGTAGATVGTVIDSGDHIHFTVEVPMDTAPNEVVYQYTGGNQTFLVPVGVTTIEVEYWGAQGSDTTTTGGAAAGGLGGYLVAQHAVTPGETLRVIVGGRTTGLSSVAGFNGGGISAGNGTDSQGGGGGGASDVRHSPYALGNRMGVAGGGGGGGCGGANGRPNVAGGDGNGNGSGSNGLNNTTTPSGRGIGATPSAGGAGGTGDGTWSPTNGIAGALGDGGAGGYYHGGGGGGGIYGGGGGGGGLGAASGGGGSGGVLDGGTVISAASGARNGHGLIKIRYS